MSSSSKKTAGEELFHSSERTNDLNISLESVTSSVSSAKKSSRRRLKRSDPSQCLEIIPMMYDRYYRQEVVVVLLLFSSLTQSHSQEVHQIAPYIHKHHDINQKMRSILVDWLVEVHFKFRLQTPTLWLCVNIMDRYLSAQLLPRNHLQLLGVSSLLIACKFEEIFPPEVQDCVYITDRAYSKAEVLQMEKLILHTLDYQLCVPTGFTFLMRYLNLIHASEVIKYLSFYYAERNLQEPDSLNIKPSLLAAGAVYAALVQQSEHHSHNIINDETDQPSIWPDILIEECDYDESDVLPIAKIIILHVSEEPVTTSLRRLISTKKKYLNDKFYHVADFSLPTFPNKDRHHHSHHPPHHPHHPLIE
jgi:G2/mitotic-specific cyclin-B, other